MSKHHRRRAHGAAKTIIVATAIFMAGSILLLWSWNTLAADLFQLPAAQFKHAVALGALIAAAFMLRVSVARIASGGSPRSGHRGDVVS
jgi:hypothetical protein